jgi:hypothetical protein
MIVDQYRRFELPGCWRSDNVVIAEGTVLSIQAGKILPPPFDAAAQARQPQPPEPTQTLTPQSERARTRADP